MTETPELLHFAEQLRKWWSFDNGQIHTHSWHDRENFIERELPKLLTRDPPSTVAGSGAALAALLTWCQIERGKLVVDGYDYKSGEEFGIRRVELQIERAIASEKEGGKAEEERCPTCRMTDAQYKRNLSWAGCTDPWHSDDHLRRKSASPAASLIAKGEGEMSGHWICEYCGYDGAHADWCRELRPVNEQWKGHRTKEEMEKLKAKDARRALASVEKK